MGDRPRFRCDRRGRGDEISRAGYTGRVHSRFHSASLQDTLSQGSNLLDVPGIRLLESSRNRIGEVFLSSPEGVQIPCILKEFRPRGIDRLKSVLIRSKACKAWRGSWALVEAGVDTPLPIAYMEKWSGLFLDHALFFALSVTDAPELRVLLRSHQEESQESLIKMLAAFVRKCHGHGILHRDLSDGNVLVREEGPPNHRFVLLDTNRIRIRKKVGRIRGIKNLIRLGVPGGYQRLFLTAYLEPHPLSLWLWQWYRSSKSLFSGYMTFKTKLRIRDIVRKLRIQ
ncbi:MAG: lipopolysaccharide kinase InaA family protein [Candidatus Aminicenantaceae bacterium]